MQSRVISKKEAIAILKKKYGFKIVDGEAYFHIINGDLSISIQSPEFIITLSTSRVSVVERRVYIPWMSSYEISQLLDP